MNYRTAILVPLLMLLMTPWGAWGQSMGEEWMAAPDLHCNVQVSADSLHFVENDYSPNSFTVTVTVTNDGDQGVGNIQANLVKDARFVVGGDGLNPKAVMPDSLGPHESGTATFTLVVATASPNDTTVAIDVTITSNRGYTTCYDSVWIEKEYRAEITCLLEQGFTEIVFSDELNRYDPDTATIRYHWENIGTADLKDARITRIVNPGISSDSTEPYRDIGVIPVTGTGMVEFGIVPLRRDNDAYVTICFQVEGRTGYKDYQTGEVPLYKDTCCIEVFIPKSRQPKYELRCEITPDSIFYRNHKYDPETFTYRLWVTNSGTAEGVLPMARLSLPPGITAADPASTQPKLVSTLLPIGIEQGPFEWTLKAQNQDSIYYLCPTEANQIIAAVVDSFEYSNTIADCCIWIDSIRHACFDVTCNSEVDTVIVDTVLGTYINGTFNVSFTVCGACSDYADSVSATLTILSSDLDIVLPHGPVKPLWEEPERITLPAGTRRDTLAADSCWTFVWPVSATSRGTSGPITLRFEIDATNADQQACELEVYVPRLDPPDLEQDCWTEPMDSLHISATTGGYDPDAIKFCTTITNYGGGTAKNVRAYFSAPENTFLDPNVPGNSSEQIVGDIPPGASIDVCWTVIPLARYDYGKDVEFRVDLTSDSQDGIAPCAKNVFIPKRPVTLAISISRDNVTYYGANVVNVPVSVDQTDGKDIHDILVHIFHNEAAPADKLLRFNTAIAGELMNNAGWGFEGYGEVSDTELYVKMSGSSPLSDYGILFYLQFTPVFGATPYHLDNFVADLLWPHQDLVDSLVKINDGSIKGILQPGAVYITGDCLRPVNASEDYVITQNKPNPFNPTTTIDYILPAASHVRITVLDVLGRPVQVLVDGEMEEGSHSVIFNAQGLPSGVYFYRMDAPGFTRIMKMMVAK